MKPFTREKLDRSRAKVKGMIRDMTTQYGLTRKEAKQLIKEAEPDELWINDKYVVSLFKNEPHGLGDVDVWHLSIRRQDREAVHDWRDFQAIKNELCGPDYEGMELYPAERRVLDAANQYHIYVVMKNVTLPFGFTQTNGKCRDDRNIGASKQRPFDDNQDNQPEGTQL